MVSSWRRLSTCRPLPRPIIGPSQQEHCLPVLQQDSMVVSPKHTLTGLLEARRLYMIRYLNSVEHHSLYINPSIIMSPSDEVVKGQAGGPYDGVKTSQLLGYWPFVGTYYDVSTNGRGPATVQGNNVQLAFANYAGYVQIRKPGFLNIPAVDLRAINFSIELTLHLPSLPTSTQTLLSNWQSGNWQYWMAFEPDGTVFFTLRRNMSTSGSDPTQDLVVVRTKVPVGRFFNAVYVYNSTQRKFSAFIDGKLADSAVVRQEVTDVTLHAATQQYVQFGNKGDDKPTTGVLDADLCQLRFYQLTF
ncbi:hypothetical protein D9619_008879 [Psilocybe cf. subviscida]|uniref:Uncharacterized protein n=1 Tax=Psilocybe cf. subviscida TaxID=2480587 RepID=A0A8H5F0U7_9AGAR|nr:hypothetical protein D9619_008879 [Psilocybe cf. subviscida]